MIAISINNLKKEINKLRMDGKKIGLCIGVFDLLHPGHIKHLEEAKKMCDVLIVGLTSDKVTKKQKGLSRPIFKEETRSYMISMIKSVDFVFIRSDYYATPSIRLIKPDFYIKGQDYANSTDKYLLLGKKMVESVGGKLIFTKTGKFAEIRTSKIINKIDDK